MSGWSSQGSGRKRLQHSFQRDAAAKNREAESRPRPVIPRWAQIGLVLCWQLLVLTSAARAGTGPPPRFGAPSSGGSSSGQASASESEETDQTEYVHYRRPAAQFIAPSIGYGLSSANQAEAYPDGDGLWAAAEYYLAVSDWFSPRSYAGLLLTFPHSQYCRDMNRDCDVSAKIGFLGVKGRLTIPIPYVAPFIEVGVGTSFGVISTKTLLLDERLEGITYHIPFSLGLSLGEHHNFDIALAYLFHPAQKQFNGAFAIGFAFRVR